MLLDTYTLDDRYMYDVYTQVQLYFIYHNQ